MDARSLAEAAGVSVGTLNVWVQRDLIPGVKIGARGRRRVFGLEAATSLLLIAELVRFGLSAPMASQIAAEVRNRGAKRLLITRLPASAGETKYRTAYCGSDADAVVQMNEIRALAERRQEPRPLIFALVDIEAMTERMRAALTEPAGSNPE